MRPLLTLIFLTCTVFAQAQENLIYPDALEFKGKVKEVNMHDGGYYIHIRYDYERKQRTIQLYHLSGKKEKLIDKEVVETFEEMRQPVRYQYDYILKKLQKVNYTYGQVVPLSAYNSMLYAKKKISSTDDEGRLSLIKYYDDKDSLISQINFIYTGAPEKECTIKAIDGAGKLSYSAQLKRNEYGHLTELKKIYSADGDALHTMEMKYTYDSHDNFTSYASIYSDIGIGCSFAREITYME
jgi:hypothetical protein